MEEHNRFKLEISEETRYEDEEISKSQAEINEELYGFMAEFKEEVAQFRAQHNEEMADIRSKLDTMMDLLHDMMKSEGLEPPDRIGAPLDQVNSDPEDTIGDVAACDEKSEPNVQKVEAFISTTPIAESEFCSKVCIVFDELTESSPAVLLKGPVIEPCARYLFDETPKSFPVDSDGGVYGKISSSKTEGLEIGHHLIDEMTELTSAEQNKRVDAHEELILPIVVFPRDLSYGSEVTKVCSFNFSSKSNLEEEFMYVDLKNHMFGADCWVDGILMFIFDPGGGFSPRMDSDVLKNDNELVEMGRETNDNNRGNLIAIVEMTENKNYVWKVLENAFTYEENLIGANGYLEYELLVDAQLDCILVFIFAKIVVNWRTSSGGLEGYGYWMGILWPVQVKIRATLPAFLNKILQMVELIEWQKQGGRLNGGVRSVCYELHVVLPRLKLLVSFIVTHLPQSAVLLTFLVTGFNASKPVWKKFMAASLLLSISNWSFGGVLSMDVDTMAILGLSAYIATAAITLRDCSVEILDKLLGEGMVIRLVVLANDNYNIPISVFGKMVQSGPNAYISVLLLDGGTTKTTLIPGAKMFDILIGLESYEIAVICKDKMSNIVNVPRSIASFTDGTWDFILLSVAAKPMDFVLGKGQNTHGYMAAWDDQYAWLGVIMKLPTLLDLKAKSSRLEHILESMVHSPITCDSFNPFDCDYKDIRGNDKKVTKPMIKVEGGNYIIKFEASVCMAYVYVIGLSKIPRKSGALLWLVYFAIKLTVFIWDPGPFADFLYILEGKDVFKEKVEAWEAKEITCGSVKMIWKLIRVVKVIQREMKMNLPGLCTIFVNILEMGPFVTIGGLAETLVKEFMIRGFVVVSPAGNVSMLDIRESETFGHIVRNLKFQDGAYKIADELKTALTNGISTCIEMMDQGQHIYGVNKFTECLPMGYWLYVCEVFLDTISMILVDALVLFVHGLVIEGFPTGAAISKIFVWDPGISHFHHLEDKAVVEGKDLSCPEVKIRKTT